MPRAYIRRDLLWCQQLAAARGGVCLSTEYVNPHTPMLWCCLHNHQWTAKANTISNGNWCGACSEVIRKDITYLQELAAAKGGKCLSSEYVNNKTKYLWWCLCGCQWEATGNDIQRGRWCPKCGRKRLSEKNSLKLSGRIFGKLTVVSRILPGGGKNKWKCNCECGKSAVVIGSDLVSGNTKSCGCILSKQEEDVFDFIKNMVPDAIRRTHKVIPPPSLCCNISEPASAYVYVLKSACMYCMY